MRTRIIVYGLLFIVLSIGVFYIALKEYAPTGLSRGTVRTYVGPHLEKEAISFEDIKKEMGEPIEEPVHVSYKEESMEEDIFEEQVPSLEDLEKEISSSHIPAGSETGEIASTKDIPEKAEETGVEEYAEEEAVEFEMIPHDDIPVEWEYKMIEE